MKVEITAKDILNRYLPAIDKVLSSKNIKLQQRPIRAAQIFAKHFIVQIEGDNMDDYFDSAWFTAFFNYITEWYQRRYRYSFQKNYLDLKGLVFIHNHPFEIHFPYSMVIDKGNEDTFSIVFLHRFRKEENWRKYIISPPDMDSLDSKLYTKIELATIAEIENHRFAFFNIGAAKTKNKEGKNFSENIYIHIGNAVSNITNSVGGNYCNALWDLQLAIEKLLKLALIQFNGNYPKTHDLNYLVSLINIDSTSRISKLLSKFPNHSEVISMRYGDPELTELNEIKGYYNVATKVIFEMSKILKKEFLTHDAIFYIKRPKYAGAKLLD